MVDVQIDVHIAVALMHLDLAGLFVQRYDELLRGHLIKVDCLDVDQTIPYLPK